ncbi:MAG: phosphoglycerate kinase [Firmicutes bacterium]|nr:phosphoglycerate kinase [Bacillota bacterium]
MAKKTILDINLKSKKVIMRVDFNVPMKDGEISDENRIVAALDSIRYILNQGGKLILLSHLGRVENEEDKKGSSLAPVAKRLAEHLNQTVTFVPFTRGKEVEEAVSNLNEGQVVMLENTRFEDVEGKKESKNNEELGKYWASLADVFVNDAFGTAHRAHASNVGIANHIETSVAGFLLEREIKFIGDTIANPERPLVAVLGGAKVSDKINVIKKLLEVADYVIITGAMAYTFYLAQGYDVGLSKVEKDKVDLALELLDLAKGKIVLGTDVVTAKDFDPESEKNIRLKSEIPSDEMGMDVGPETLKTYFSYIEKAKTVIWNGPLGVFEFPRFAEGTKGFAKKLVELKDSVTTIIGGGDSAAAVIQFGYENDFAHISTGGGASLEYLEGKLLPGIACVDDK